MLHIQENISLKKLNTFGIHATARYFIEVATLSELEMALSFQKKEKISLLVLGGGSNILFVKDFDGLVVKINLKGIHVLEEEQESEHVYVRAEAGENWHEFVLFCIKNNLAGVENLSLIPGTIGAAPMQNIGAYGVEIREVFEYLEAYHIQTGRLERFDKEQCGFGYRESVFKNNVKGQYIITAVMFRLNKTPYLNLSYGDIEQVLAKENRTPSISNISWAIIGIRQSKLPDPAKIGNAGSFFKNPYVPLSKLAQLKISYPSIPAYPLGAEQVKIPAAWLIEQVGWKGYREGDVGVHHLQPLVLVNHGNAQGAEIWQLSERIKASVLEKFGIQLSTEVNIIGS